MTKNMNREQMTISSRRALSSLAGVDNRTMQEVAEMNMRSAGANAQMISEVTDGLLSERAVASNDFSF